MTKHQCGLIHVWRDNDGWTITIGTHTGEVMVRGTTLDIAIANIKRSMEDMEQTFTVQLAVSLATCRIPGNA